MEKIKVNMSPNPLDVQTIHASQNDGEARQWEFELHNNGELIDTSEITEQMVFKSYKGGTEQLLPENGSTPTTSPFLGNIKYPQGLLSDQEFTYRQSPTEEDGLAKITDIKGNTLNWNQQHHEQSSTYWSASNASSSYADGVGTFTASSDGTFGQNLKSTYRYSVSGHKYLFLCTVKSSSGGDFNFGLRNTFVTETLLANTEKTVMSIQTATTANDNVIFYRGNATSGDTLTIKNSMCFDLTQMGLDITDPSDFTSLFPLSYYSYNQGSLLSFNGNGIKTVGFNQWDEQWEVGAISDTTGQNTTSTNRIRSKNYIKVIPSQTYYLCMPQYGLWVYWYDANYNYLGRRNPRYAGNTFEIIEEGCNYIRFEVFSEYGTTYKNNICINISNTELNGTYKPYTSSTLSLPISTYFPNGMKSAGSVYDELTESKAITRIGAVDLGSLNWTYQSSSENMYVDNVVSNRKNNLGFNAICSKYQQVNEDTISGVSSLTQDKSFAFQYSFNGRIIVRDTSYTDATVFKQAMADQNVKLYYELATPTETSFTTASLVTENAEIPLSNNDGVLIGKCTEELSAEPGFHDAKIKLTDADGECYSNKIQLHVERSPQ